ncbi:DnaB-like helicase C-terminal domain-containing protein [Vibrio panuliri]|uniref:DnaB-like helicase C-terminal domain-containing protein n=3 Tax=Vibrio panuliri TaxID=1381081 RepID=UPI00385134E2
MQSTCERFNYKVGFWNNGEPVHIAEARDANGQLRAQKVRLVKEKDFRVIGDLSNVLIGMNLWRGGKKLIVTEGELDMLSVGQLLDRTPVVSLPNGVSSAKRVLMANMDWLLGFDEIILFFDNDDKGREAVEECVRLFPPKRVLIAELANYKDANEALMAGAGRDVMIAVWEAKHYKPQGLFSGLEVLERGDEPITQGWETPYPSLTHLSYGIKPGDLVCIGAGTGCGKTHLMKMMAAHMIKHHGLTVATLFLEEPQLMKTIDSIAGIIDGVDYLNPHLKLTDEQKVQKDETKRLVASHLVLYKVDASAEPDEILLVMRHMKASGAEVIFFDHVTYVLDGIAGDNEVKALKLLMRNLNTLAKELNFALVYASQLRKTDGSRAQSERGGFFGLDDFHGGKSNVQYASLVLGVVRDQASDDKDLNTLFILKCRDNGNATGQSIELRYQPDTTRKIEVNPLDEIYKE